MHRKLKNWTEKNSIKKERKVHLSFPKKKPVFLNKTTQKIRATSNTSNSNFNAKIPRWSEASISEEEEIGISKCRRKSYVEIIN